MGADKGPADHPAGGGGPLSKEAPWITGQTNVIQNTKILGFWGSDCIIVTEGITVVWIAFL
jgi:hypothetical protein